MTLFPAILSGTVAQLQTHPKEVQCSNTISPNQTAPLNLKESMAIIEELHMCHRYSVDKLKHMSPCDCRHSHDIHGNLFFLAYPAIADQNQ